MLAIRSASLADNRRILNILRQVGVVTPKENYCLEREPEAFALPDYQGVETKILVASENDRLLGLICLSVDQVYFEGEPQPVGFSSELRVLPDARGKGLGQRLEAALWQTLQVIAGERAILYTAVDRHNPVGLRMNQSLGQQGLTQMEVQTEILTCFWPVLQAAWPLPARQGYLYRLATPCDYPAMQALWAELSPQRQLARYYAPGEWASARHFPAAQRWILVESPQELLGFIGLWDQRALRQIQLLEPPWLMRALGWRPGRAMPLGHGLHLCLRPQARPALSGLIRRAMREAQGLGLQILSLALDTQDPLSEWLPRYQGSYGRMHLLGNQRPAKLKPFHLEMSLG